MKIGIQQFDILHAYGLGILLATACDEPVELRDMACHYILSSSALQLPRMSYDSLLEKVLPLPREEDVRACAPSARAQRLSVTVLDGLLTALFTTPGSRILSVSDLLGRLRLDEKALQRGIRKVAKSISRWKKFAGREAEGKEADWLADVLRDYNREHPAFPVLVEGSPGKDVNVLIPIDPSFGYSLRSAQSLGRMTQKTQVAVRGTRYGALLAFVGAARFLRAQRLCFYRRMKVQTRPCFCAGSPLRSRTRRRGEYGAHSRIRPCSPRDNSSRFLWRAACWRLGGWLPSRNISAQV